MKHNPRIFIGVHEVAGYYKGLQQGFEANGVSCEFVNLKPHKYKYETAGYKSGIHRIIDYISGKKEKTKSKFWEWLHTLSRIPLFVWALFRFDVFIFGFAMTFFSNTKLFRVTGYIDLYLIKKLKKKIIFQFHGSDSRPEYIDGALMKPENNLQVEDIIRKARQKKGHLRSIDHYADFIIDIPPQGGYFHEVPFINWMYIGLPSGLNSDADHAEASNAETINNKDAGVRILHCPSSPWAKGSYFVSDVIDQLKSKGYKIDFIQITNQPNQVVITELRKCDFVIDQAYADYPMPGFATEAAWMGKPVVIGGNCVDLWDTLLDDDARPPTLYCYPEDMGKVIEHLITDNQFRLEQSRKHLEFMQSKWHPKYVAQRYLRLINDDIPEKWWYNPYEMNEIFGGFFMSREKAQHIVKEVIQKGGIKALQLQDKPMLEKAFLAFAKATVNSN